MDSSAPNPQQIGLQSADTRAVEAQSAEAQTDDQQRSANVPSLLKEVLESLKDEEDEDIFAWLRLARSVRSKSEYSSKLACLTRAQLRAVALLKHCNDDQVSAFLHRVRTSSTSNQSSTTGQ